MCKAFIATADAIKKYAWHHQLGIETLNLAAELELRAMRKAGALISLYECEVS